MEEMKKQPYLLPAVEVLDCCVEAGFATSPGGYNEGGWDEPAD